MNKTGLNGLYLLHEAAVKMPKFVRLNLLT